MVFSVCYGSENIGAAGCAAGISKHYWNKKEKCNLVTLIYSPCRSSIGTAGCAAGNFKALLEQERKMQFSYVNLFTLPQFFFLNFVLLPAVDHLLRACEHAACKAARFINKYQKFIQAERELEKSRRAKRSAHFFFFFFSLEKSVIASKCFVST